MDVAGDLSVHSAAATEAIDDADANGCGEGGQGDGQEFEVEVREFGGGHRKASCPMR